MCNLALVSTDTVLFFTDVYKTPTRNECIPHSYLSETGFAGQPKTTALISSGSAFTKEDVEMNRSPVLAL